MTVPYFKKTAYLIRSVLLFLTLIMVSTSCRPSPSSDTPPSDTPSESPSETQAVTEAPTEESVAETTPQLTGVTYYVDSQHGHDENDGLTPETAIKTLEKANTITLKGGDSLLLKAGCTFEGHLNPHRERDGGIIRISSYGEGDKPLIASNGENALTLTDFDFIEVSNIAVTNPEGQSGIYIANRKGGAVKHVHIQNCRIEQVNQSRSTFRYESGGIICEAFSEEPGWFEDLLLEGNEIKDVARSGIFLTSFWVDRPDYAWGKNEYISDTEGWWPSYGVVVRGNYIDETGGDGIVLIGTVDALIEYNTVYRINTNPVAPCANAGIWPQKSNGCVIQYNEVAYANKPEGVSDAQAFDVDAACRDTRIQYNYSHDNAGGFLLLCDSYYGGVTVRNNVSVNDGTGELIAMVGPVKDILIENNTFITRDHVFRLVNCWSPDGTSSAHDVQIRRNIFIANGTGNDFNLETGYHFEFEGNLYWGAHKTPPANEIDPIVANPKIRIATAAPKGWDSARQFASPEGSPVYSTATEAVNPADKDYFGNPTKGADYVGAFATAPKSE